jgi:hypothetical protein
MNAKSTVDNEEMSTQIIHVLCHAHILIPQLLLLVVPQVPAADVQPVLGTAPGSGAGAAAGQLRQPAAAAGVYKEPDKQHHAWVVAQLGLSTEQQQRIAAGFRVFK